MTAPLPIDEIDRRIVVATQAGLPLCEAPYDAVAQEVGSSVDDVMRRMTRLLAAGAIRRIAAVPNHYALGYRANGMSVWDIADERISETGHMVGALPFVSHCYRRPRRLPDWPYNLFAMVHGRARAEVEAKVEEIAHLLGAASRGHTVLYSTRILKKTGLRFAG
ncbi:MAG: AsnC family transcriptional regulator [Alphaproteobacteria bacterium]